MLKSQEVRRLAPEMDPLRMGMGWKVGDLDKPQIMVESTFGDSHPGSAHLNRFVEEVVQGVNESGGKAARYFATDMCDGIAQGHDGINYSLPHRDAIVNLVEAQANATGFDGGVFIASCDKSAERDERHRRHRRCHGGAHAAEAVCCAGSGLRDQ